MECVKSTLTEHPKAGFYVFFLHRIVQTAFLALTVAGIIPKSGFAIGTYSLIAFEATMMGLTCHRCTCCDKNKNIAIALSIYILINSILPLLGISGAMNLQNCAWTLLGATLFSFAGGMIAYGVKDIIGHKQNITFR
ncbi:MAG: hypothetical protein H7A36_05840 [Chlamydiales bacterium]|nr:hypothetical protein [Chlamydiales bacterium]